MVVCKNCGKQTVPGNFCGFCGQPLLETTVNVNKSQQDISSEHENHRMPTGNDYNYTHQIDYQQSSQQSTYQNTNQDAYYQETYQQQGSYQQQHGQQGTYNHYNNQQTNQVYTQKSVFLGIVLSVILPGLGHIYVGKKREGIILIIVYLLLLLFATLIIPAILAFFLWIYSIIKTINMIENHNQGLPY